MPDTNTRISPYVPGQGRIMVTDHGPHPADAWAQITAEHIAPIGKDVTGHRRLKALELQAKIALAIEPHHQKVQNDEGIKLGVDTAHVMNPVDPSEHLDAAVKAIQDAAVGTEWEGHFKDPERVALIRQEVASHVATIQHIEKSWHADKNPDHPASVAFRAQHHPVGA